jgi:hypothetical protein
MTDAPEPAEGKKWLMTPVVTLSYPKLFKAELGRNPLPGSQPRRSTDALLTAADLEDPLFRAILAACIACAQAEWGSAAIDMLKRKQLKLPFREDCAARNYPSEYVRFFTAAAVENPNHPVPEIIDITGKKITDVRLVYPGVRARLMVDPYARKLETNKGIALGLGNIQIVANGPRLAGGVAVDPKTQFPLGAAPAEDPMSAFAGGNKDMTDEIPY